MKKFRVRAEILKWRNDFRASNESEYRILNTFFSFVRKGHSQQYDTLEIPVVLNCH
jgi:hypothetical protein